MWAEQRKDASHQLHDEARVPRIELLELQTTLCELRQSMAAAIGNNKMIDLPPKLRRVCYPERIHCEACRNDLEPNAPIYRVALSYSHPWVRTPICPATIIRVCAACCPSVLWGWWPPSPCLHCGRPIIASRNRRPPKLFCCSAKCDAAVLNAAARRERRSRRTERSCNGCRKPFEPKRADATYCSPACRQLAYRQRRKLADAL